MPSSTVPGKGYWVGPSINKFHHLSNSKQRRKILCSIPEKYLSNFTFGNHPQGSQLTFLFSKAQFIFNFLFCVMNSVDALLFHSIITIILGADILALGFSLVPQMVKNPLAIQETWV